MTWLIRPGPGRIAVKLTAGDALSDGGIWIPESARSEGHIGEVMVTCGKYRDEQGNEFDPDYEVGQTVIFGKYTGTEVKVGRETYIILRESEILCTLKEVPDDAGTA